tara:strand:+ start:1979 stop:2251 length:273 start_codon:yes stop_codon:yes gene_type:complete
MSDDARAASLQMLEGTIRGLVQDYGRASVRSAFETVIGPRATTPCDNEACEEKCDECNVCVSCLCAEYDAKLSKMSRFVIDATNLNERNK